MQKDNTHLQELPAPPIVENNDTIVYGLPEYPFAGLENIVISSKHKNNSSKAQKIYNASRFTTRTAMVYASILLLVTYLSYLIEKAIQELQYPEAGFVRPPASWQAVVRKNKLFSGIVPIQDWVNGKNDEGDIIPIFWLCVTSFSLLAAYYVLVKPGVKHFAPQQVVTLQRIEESYHQTHSVADLLKQIGWLTLGSALIIIIADSIDMTKEGVAPALSALMSTTALGAMAIPVAIKFLNETLKKVIPQLMHWLEGYEQIPNQPTTRCTLCC